MHVFTSFEIRICAKKTATKETNIQYPISADKCKDYNSTDNYKDYNDKMEGTNHGMNAAMMDPLMISLLSYQSSLSSTQLHYYVTLYK